METYLYCQTIFLALVCLVIPWLARMAGYEIGRKAFDLVGVGEIFFLLAAAFGLGGALVDMLAQTGRAFMVVTFALGWIALFAGAIWGTVDVIREPQHELAHKGARA